MALIAWYMMFWLYHACCALFIWFNASFAELTRLLCNRIDSRRYVQRPLFFVIRRVKMDVQVQRKVFERDYHVLLTKHHCNLFFIRCLLFGFDYVADDYRCFCFPLICHDVAVLILRKSLLWNFIISVLIIVEEFCEVVVFVLCCIPRPLHLF